MSQVCSPSAHRPRTPETVQEAMAPGTQVVPNAHAGSPAQSPSLQSESPSQSSSPGNEQSSGRAPGRKSGTHGSQIPLPKPSSTHSCCPSLQIPGAPIEQYWKPPMMHPVEGAVQAGSAEQSGSEQSVALSQSSSSPLEQSSGVPKLI